MSDYKSCSKCKKECSIDLFCKDKSKKDGLHPHCKSCRTKRQRKYYSNNKESILSKHANWHNNNKEYHTKINRENSRRHREKYPEKWKQYYEENKADYAARTAKRRAVKSAATPEWGDFEYIKFIYKMARWLSMEVDHIVPLQSNIVCGLHCEDNLQLLSMFDNRSKGNKHQVGG